jgi:transposase-like protein
LLLEDAQSLLSGQVEVDETYVGGSRRNTIGRTGDHKSPVLAMVERQGRVYATTVKDAARSTLMPHIESRVLPASVVYTDEWKSYAQLGKRGYVHKRIQHKQKVYVRGDVHTNTIEGFFSLLKRGISGVYHLVSAKHLQGYLDEYTFRYNHRDDDKPMFRTLLENVASGQASLLASDSPS